MMTNTTEQSTNRKKESEDNPDNWDEKRRREEYMKIKSGQKKKDYKRQEELEYGQNKEEIEDFEREELVYLAGLMQQCEQYHQMMEYTYAYAEQSTEELTKDERKMLVVAYKNVVGELRTALRATGRIEAMEK